MAIGSKLRVEPLRSLAAGSIVASYAPVGVEIDNPASLLIIQNFTDADLMFSFTGNTDHIPLKAGASFTSDITANKSSNSDLMISVGTRIHVKRIGTPTTGSVYVSSFYGSLR
jgi:hypothetical protein